MSPEILSGTEIEKAFKKALEDREFSVWYQPQVDMRTGGIRGAEALVRWQKKNGEMILPDLFVPVLEKRGLMPLLGAVSAYFATRHGVNNYLAWLAPPLCAYLAHYIVTTYAPSDAGPTLLTAFLSIIGAAAGHVRNEQTK